MIMSSLLIAAASVASANCTFLPPQGDHHWLAGEYIAKSVVPALQDEMMMRLEGQPLEPVDLSLARSASGDDGLPASRYYYLVTATFVGGTGDPKDIGQGTSLSVDVDDQGTAYVTSYRLTSETGTTGFAAILVSQTQITKVVPICGAAE